MEVSGIDTSPIGGYNKVYRMLQYRLITPEAMGAFVLLLCRANFKDGRVLNKKGALISGCDRGEVITSHEALKKQWQWGGTERVRKMLKGLRGAGLIKSRVRMNRGVVITILNYDSYNTPPDPSGYSRTNSSVDSSASKQVDSSPTSLRSKKARNSGGSVETDLAAALDQVEDS